MAGQGNSGAFRVLIARGARLSLPAIAVAAGVLLILADSATLREIRVFGVDVARVSAGSHHVHALLVVGALSLPAAIYGAVRRSRKALFALVIAGLAALVVALAVDAPSAGSTSPYNQFYADAGARSGGAVGQELVAGALLLASGLLQLVILGPKSLPRRRSLTRTPRAVASNGV
jgi:hypothetical protein